MDTAGSPGKMGAVTADSDDWRRMGQEKFLKPGTAFVLKRYRAYSDEWEHDHCSMCTVKFMDPNHSPESAAMVANDPDILLEGYATTEDFVRGAEYEWVCAECFGDFAEELGWVDATPISE